MTGTYAEHLDVIAELARLTQFSEFAYLASLARNIDGGYNCEVACAACTEDESYEHNSAGWSGGVYNQNGAAGFGRSIIAGGDDTVTLTIPNRFGRRIYKVTWNTTGASGGGSTVLRAGTVMANEGPVVWSGINYGTWTPSIDGDVFSLQVTGGASLSLHINRFIVSYICD
jgi:hypothetical protein